VAVVQKVDLALVPAGRESALPGATAAAEGVSAAVDVGAVGVQAGDGAIGSAVADLVVDLERQRVTVGISTIGGPGVEHRQAIARVV
jgi:hypothetical protein